MKFKSILFLILVTAFLSCETKTKGDVAVSNDTYKMDRSVLPIQPPAHEKVTIMDARDAEKPETFSVEAPEGAPNIVVVLIDDIGFGATSTFGGAISTPTFDKLADEGLRFNRFHTVRQLCVVTWRLRVVMRRLRVVMRRGAAQVLVPAGRPPTAADGILRDRRATRACHPSHARL